MGAKTDIEWAYATWNPVYGCSMAKGSEKKGCLNCYACALHARNLPGLVAITGKPLAVRRPSGLRWTGDVGLIEKALDLPLSWRTPRRIFVNSLSDLFHERLGVDVIDRVVSVMRRCPRHRFLVLTKRPERLAEYSRFRDIAVENIWWGTSIEDDQTARLRVPHLQQAHVRNRFLSYEPALGEVNWTAIDPAGIIDWIIVGGESGPGARSLDIRWIHSAIDAGRRAGNPVFVKQFGALPVYGETFLRLSDPKGGNPDEWPAHLRIRELPPDLASIAKSSKISTFQRGHYSEPQSGAISRQ